MNTKHTPPNKMTGIRMVGSVHIDEDEIPVDGVYYRRGAENALRKIDSLLIDNDAYNKAFRILGRWWNKDRTWKQISESAWRMAKLIKILCHDKENTV